MGILHRSLKAVSGEDYTDSKTISEMEDYRDSLSTLTPVFAPESALKDLLLVLIDQLLDTSTVSETSLDSLIYNMPDSLWTDTMYENKNWGLDSTRKASLVYLANLCPFEYGFAVYMARNILWTLDDRTISYSDSCGISGGMFRMEHHNTTNNSNVLVGNPYPNPGTGSYSLKYDIGKEDQLELEVFDVLGRPMLSKNLSNEQKSYRFDLNASEGVYLYRILLNQKPYKNGKIILVK